MGLLLLLVPASAVAATISGSVFEDVNYGGGAGRSLAVSSGPLRPGARVELFDAAGAFVTFVTTDGSGNYSFAALGAGNYTVRVVNSSVTSSRPNAVAGLLPVQTFRTNASGGTAAADVNRVGGEDPTKIDAGDGSTTLAALTTGTTTAQSVAPVTLGAPNITGVDFGFNFDTIVSTQDAGQGSLRAFLTNSNTLGNAGLAQVGQAAGVEASVFMISDGIAHPGLRAGLTNQLTGGVAEISPVSLLPSITDPATRIDGATQTANVGNTNPVLLGAGGTVGVDALTLGQVAGPEVSIRDGAALATGVRIAANNAIVRGLAIRGFDDAGIRIDDGFTGALIENNVLGSTATSFVDPGAAERGVGGVDSQGGDSGTIRNNLIGFHDIRGIYLAVGSTGWTVVGNEIRDSGQATDNGDGIAINASSANNTTGNLIVGSSSQGWLVTVGASGNTLTNNTLTGNGVGTPTVLSQSGAITLRTTAVGSLIDRNVIRLNYGAAVLVNDGATTARMTRNSFAGNGTITARNGGAPTGQIGIDLNTAGDSADLGTAPFVTLNDTGDVDSGGNGLLNFPILASAVLNGGNLTLSGFARPGSVIELFIGDPDPSGFGEGETYKITLTEGGSGAGGNDPYADTDATTGTYGPAAINGILQGTDTTNRFAFTLPVPSGITTGTVLTSTATLGAETSEFSGHATVTTPAADLALSKTDNPDPAPAGGELLYTLLVTNNGPDNATNVVLTDTLPAGVTLISATPIQGSCSGTTTVTCNLGGILNGGTASVEILVVAGAVGSITNTATVTATEIDPVAGNNSANVGTTVVDGGTTDIPLTLYRRVHGFVDYTVTGGTLRTASNGGGACLVGTSSTAALSGIPAAATVTHAYLYWGGSGSTVDSQITLDAAALTADRTWTAQYVLGATTYDYFGGFEDVTAYVQGKRNGNYTFADLTVATGNPHCSLQAVLAGWSLIVIYDDSTVTGKTLVLYDGFDVTRNGSSSYLLSGIYASPPPEGKTTTLLWEGDDTLAGANESLVFNGVALSDGLNPVNNAYNSTINTLGSSTSYGVDLDTFDVSSTIAARDSLATMTVNTGPDLVILNAVVLAVKSNIIVGTVFEDVNYGGGAGRDLAVAVAAAPSFSVPRPGAVVELYDAAGAFLRTTTTNAAGEYGFAGLVDGNYTVRVVNGSVGSSRPGALATLRAVQTFRTDAGTGAALPVTTEVGGTSPKDQDGPANTTNANLASFIAQSKAPVQIITGVTVAGADFGYNFDTVVNTADAGQGSLRQFIINSNALGNANLAQTGLPAGVEHSLFMIPSTTDPLGRAADPGFDAGRGVAVIAPIASLPSLTDTATAIDGTTQTTEVGDTNPGTLGVGGTVGTGADGIGGNADDAPLSVVDRPEIELGDANALPTGLEIAANDAVLRGLAIYGFGNGLFNDGFANIKVGSNGTNYTGTLIEQNLIGTNATSFTDPGAGVRTDGDNVRVNGGDSGTIRDNLIGFATGSGVGLLYGSDGWTVTGNEIRRQGLGSSLADGVGLESSSTHSIAGNLIVDTRGVGIDMYLSAGSTTITGNTISGNGIAGNETPGVRIYGASNVITSNRIEANYGAGVMIVDTASGNRVSRNSIFGNGTILTESGGGASNQIGIDLLAAGNNASSGTAPFVTPNDGLDPDAGGNGLLNFPMPTWAIAANSTVTVGFNLDVPAGSYRVEFFKNPSGADPSGHGEGQTFVSAVSVTHPGGGTQGFTHGFPGATGDVVTATTTACTDGAACAVLGSTSEFGPAQTVTTLTVVKRAFRADGTPIANGVVLPRGTPVKFVLYVSNPGAVASDVSLRDVLDPTFAYIAGSVRFADTTPACAQPTCTVGEEAAIFAAVDAGTVGTDGVDGDVVSYAGQTVDAGNQYAANLQLDIPAGRVLALVFTVHMQ